MKKNKILIIASLLASVSVYAQKESSPAKEEIFTKVEQQASFKGGMTSFYKFAIANLKYPEEAKKYNIEGKVFLQFVVGKDGKLEEIKVLRGIGYGCDKAALDLIKKSPNWIPGKQRGKTVKVQIVLPISFKLS